MKNIILLVFLFSTNLNSQEIIVVDKPHIFEYNDRFYELRMVGIKNFMTDLNIENHQIHDKILPDYLRLKNREKISWLGLSVGLGGSTIWYLATINNILNDPNPSFNSSSLILPSLLLIGGMAVNLTYANYRRDFLNFISKHNLTNPDRKIDLRIEIQSHSGIGPSILASF